MVVFTVVKVHLDAHFKELNVVDMNGNQICSTRTAHKGIYFSERTVFFCYCYMKLIRYIKDFPLLRHIHKKGIANSDILYSKFEEEILRIVSRSDTLMTLLRTFIIDIDQEEVMNMRMHPTNISIVVAILKFQNAGPNKMFSDNFDSEYSRYFHDTKPTSNRQRNNNNHNNNTKETNDQINKHCDEGFCYCKKCVEKLWSWSINKTTPIGSDDVNAIISILQEQVNMNDKVQVYMRDSRLFAAFEKLMIGEPDLECDEEDNRTSLLVDEMKREQEKEEEEEEIRYPHEVYVFEMTNPHDIRIVEVRTVNNIGMVDITKYGKTIENADDSSVNLDKEINEQTDHCNEVADLHLETVSEISEEFAEQQSQSLDDDLNKSPIIDQKVKEVIEEQCNSLNNVEDKDEEDVEEIDGEMKSPNKDQKRTIEDESKSEFDNINNEQSVVQITINNEKGIINLYTGNVNEMATNNSADNRTKTDQVFECDNNKLNVNIAKMQNDTVQEVNNDYEKSVGEQTVNSNNLPDNVSDVGKLSTKEENDLSAKDLQDMKNILNLPVQPIINEISAQIEEDADISDNIDHLNCDSHVTIGTTDSKVELIDEEQLQNDLNRNTLNKCRRYVQEALVLLNAKPTTSNKLVLNVDGLKKKGNSLFVWSDFKTTSIKKSNSKQN